MVISKEYKDLLASGVVTTEMMCDALFSLNKRAKNYRDVMRESRRKYGSHFVGSETAMQDMYTKKERLLSFLSPVCIHQEFAGFRRVRVYDYEKQYEELYLKKRLSMSVVWQNCYFDGCREVWFFDYVTNEPSYRYYLYYICGEHTFHTPVEVSDLDQYDLDIVMIDTIQTTGHSYTDLMSMQFVNKILSTLETKTAVYQETIPCVDCSKPFELKSDMNTGTKEFSVFDLENIMTFAAPSIIRQFRQVHNIKADEKLCEELRKKVVIQYGKPKKNGRNRIPKVRFSSEVHAVEPYKRLSSYTFLIELANQLKTVSDEDGRYQLFFALCLSDASLIYTDLCNDLQLEASMQSVRNAMQMAVSSFYKSDPDRKIVNRNGNLEYE